MTSQDELAIATTLNLILDEIKSRGDSGTKLLREAVSGIGDLLGEGGLGPMGRVLDIVLDQKPDDETWRDDLIDRLWSGFGGWAS